MNFSVNQVIVGASARDAITNMSLALKESLCAFFKSAVYSYFEPEESARGDVQHISNFPLGTKDDLLIYHLSYGIPILTRWLLSRPEKLVIHYHNITPGKYYENFDHEFAAGLNWGREELKVLSHKIVKIITDSEYNRRDLESMGFFDVEVIPGGVVPTRLDKSGLSLQLLMALQRHYPQGFLLSMSQVLPHKRTELAIATCFILNNFFAINIGLVVAGAQRNISYLRSLEHYVERLGLTNVWFIGEVSENELKTLYQSATFLIGTSDHEGLCIPPLEAMANDLVCIVRGCGAVIDTVGDGALVLDEEAGVIEMASLIAYLHSDDDYRALLRANGRNRVKEIEQLHTEKTFCDAIIKII